jgi:hypothetical protein
MSSDGRIRGTTVRARSEPIRRMFQKRGLATERVPLRGAARGRFVGDISVPGLGRDFVVRRSVEATDLAVSMTTCSRDFSVLRPDRKPMLTLELAARILAAAECTKGSAP